MSLFSSKNKPLEEKNRIEKKDLEKEILDLKERQDALKRRHAAEVDQLKNAFSDRDWRLQLAEKKTARVLEEEKTRHVAELAQLQQECAANAHAWKDKCDRIQVSLNIAEENRDRSERKRRRQIAELESAIVGQKAKTTTYELRLGNALSTQERRKERIKTLKAEKAELRALLEPDQNHSV